MTIQRAASLQNVHYWDSSEKNITKSVSSELPVTDDKKKETASFFQNYQSSFDAALFDVLGQGSHYSNKMYSNSFFGYDLNSPDQLRDATKRAKEMGMEKVLAAQLASPLPYSSNNNDNDGSNDDSAYDGLNSMANLTIQLAMAKAQKVFDHLNKQKTMSLEEYLKFLES